MFLPLFHASVVVVNSYTLWYDQKYMDLPFPAKGYEELPLKGRTMFLTMWCLALQTVYFTISFLNDFFGTNEESPRKPPLIRKLKDYIFSLAFPTAIYVVTGFWTIYSIDKNLIFPEHIEAQVPFWANAVLHITVAIFIAIELMVTRVSYPSRKFGIVLLVLFNCSYLVWMHILRERTGKWAYPLFEKLDLLTRIIFFSLSLTVGLGLYVLGDTLSSLISSKSKNQLNGVYRVNGVANKKL